MYTLMLLVWMSIGNDHMLTVQVIPAEMCGRMREHMAAQPGVTHAMCAGSEKTVLNAVEVGACQPVQDRESFVTFACNGVLPKWK